MEDGDRPDAGDFGAWLDGMTAALDDGTASDVPCGSCTACCTASQFVHVAPDEADALAHIPRELLFPAPGAPPGHLLMGYDEQGRCPMLVDGACSVYAHRPRTCRTYDCRVFPAAGIEPTEPAKAGIADRARRWRFTDPSPDDQVRRAAVRAAAAFVRGRPEVVAADAAPPTDTQVAVLAVELHGVFVASDAATGAPALREPSAEEVRVQIDRVRRRPG